jgi:hypothetical protein
MTKVSEYLKLTKDVKRHTRAFGWRKLDAPYEDAEIAQRLE